MAKKNKIVKRFGVILKNSSSQPKTVELFNVFEPLEKGVGVSVVTSENKVWEYYQFIKFITAINIVVEADSDFEHGGWQIHGKYLADDKRDQFYIGKIQFVIVKLAPYEQLEIQFKIIATEIISLDTDKKYKL